MRYIVCFLFSLFLAGANAQIKPEFFPEDATEEGIAVRCFCKPGVKNKSRSKGLKLEYSYLSGGDFLAEDTIFQQPFSSLKSIQQFEVDMKAPIINKKGFKFLIGYKYFSEKYSINTAGADYNETFRQLGKGTLKSSSVSVFLTKPLDERRYTAFRLRYSANGNYSGIINFDQQYAIYKLLGMYAIKKSEDFEWGFGLNFVKSFRRTNILPFLLFNKNFNNRWGLESALPGYVFGRLNANQGNILLFGVEYNSQSYRMGIKDTPTGDLDFALNHSEILFSVELEHQFAKWIWASVKSGYQLNFSTDFEEKSANTTSFNAEPTSPFFFRVGLFVSPPDLD
ncbi:MAG: DUF6268 family outer membrane beta-barrel protein [Saprospiraceae bacterium]